MSLNLIFSNKPSSLNKKLIKFFQINLLSLNKASLTFKFEVAHPEDMDKYISRGIKNYPVLIHNTTSITGVEKIISYLKLHVKKYNNKIVNKTDDERVDEFWKQTIGKINVDESGKIQDDEDEDDDGDLHKKIQEAFRDRNNATETVKKPTSFKRTNNVSQGSTRVYNSPTDGNDETPSDTIKKMSSKKGSCMDDELMAKFFENQEESI